jgi:hypothetical protein
MVWEYRIIKASDEDKKSYSLQEVLLDEDGCMVAHTIDFIIESDNINEMETILNEMKEAFDKPILTEIPSIIDYDSSD